VLFCCLWLAALRQRPMPLAERPHLGAAITPRPRAAKNKKFGAAAATPRATDGRTNLGNNNNHHHTQSTRSSAAAKPRAGLSSSQLLRPWPPSAAIVANSSVLAAAPLLSAVAITAAVAGGLQGMARHQRAPAAPARQQHNTSSDKTARCDCAVRQSRILLAMLMRCI
jgi:hypothetical protein